MFMTEFDEERQRRLDRRDGFEEGMQQSLRNLMNASGIGLDEAMGLFGNPADERARYADLLAETR